MRALRKLALIAGALLIGAGVGLALGTRDAAAAACDPVSTDCHLYGVGSPDLTTFTTGSTLRQGGVVFSVDQTTYMTELRWYRPADTSQTPTEAHLWAGSSEVWSYNDLAGFPDTAVGWKVTTIPSSLRPALTPGTSYTLSYVYPATGVARHSSITLVPDDPPINYTTGAAGNVSSTSGTGRPTTTTTNYHLVDFTLRADTATATPTPTSTPPPTSTPSPTPTAIGWECGNAEGSGNFHPAIYRNSVNGGTVEANTRPTIHWNISGSAHLCIGRAEPAGTRSGTASGSNVRTSWEFNAPSTSVYTNLTTGSGTSGQGSVTLNPWPTGGSNATIWFPALTPSGGLAHWAVYEPPVPGLAYGGICTVAYQGDQSLILGGWQCDTTDVHFVTPTPNGGIATNTPSTTPTASGGEGPSATPGPSGTPASGTPGPGQTPGTGGGTINLQCTGGAGSPCYVRSPEIEAILTAIATAIDGATAAIGTATTTLADAATAGTQAVTAGLAALGEQLATATAGLGTLVTSGLTGVQTSIAAAASGIGFLITTSVGELTAEVTASATQTMQALSSLGNDIAQAASGIQTALTGGMTALSSLGENLVTAIGALPAAVVQAVGDGVSAALVPDAGWLADRQATTSGLVSDRTAILTDVATAATGLGDAIDAGGCTDWPGVRGNLPDWLGGANVVLVPGPFVAQFWCPFLPLANGLIDFTAALWGLFAVLNILSGVAWWSQGASSGGGEHAFRGAVRTVIKRG
jgi:hypothetical protein